jgi:Cu-Zn family superoxide dismutase
MNTMPACRIVSALFAAMAVVGAGGCASSGADRATAADFMSELLGEAGAVATARLQGVQGSGIEGKVTFAQYGAVLVVRASFIGLAANREYGLHVHEKGDCRADGANAGGHFNPTGAPHGRPGRGTHHAGDLPNLRTDGEGAVIYLHRTSALSIVEGPIRAVGRSVIVSRDADDYETQPDGRSGPPLACGVIRLN